VPVGERQSRIMAAAVARGINLRDVGADRIGISVDETTTEADLEAVCRAFGILKPPAQVLPAIPDALMRVTDYLTHPIFHMNRAESEMMRYMRRLSDRDLALDRAMIPLGSCTMKLNASVEMMPITWPEFNAIHPFAPADQAEGYAAMIEDLTARLCEITGYDAMSMQPNSGAQGEYAGLLTIAAYHKARGDDGRTHLPDPGVGPWHEPGLGAHGGDGGGRRGRGRERRYRPCGFRRQGGGRGRRLAAA
jgi:glycine dehydrogenase